MKKKGLLVSLSLLLVLILVACAQPKAPAPTTPAPAPAAPAPAPAAPKPTTAAPAPGPAAAAPILLRFATWAPPTADMGWTAAWSARELEKRAGGKIKMEYYFAGTLLSQKTIAKGIGDGVADIASFGPNFTPGAFPLLTVVGEPVIQADLWSGGMALSEFVKLPEIQAEFDANNLVYFGLGGGAFDLEIMSRAPIKTLKDLAGKKINSTSMGPEILNAMGAVTMQVPSPEIYDALQKGTLDGAATTAAGADVYKYYEVAKYWYRIPFGNSPWIGIMGKDAYKKLTPDLQKLVQDMIPDIVEATFAVNGVLGNTRSFETKIKPNMKEVFQPTSDDVATLWKLAAEASWAKWVKGVNDRGLPGQKILDTWVQLNKKYQAMPHPKDQDLTTKYKPYYDLPRK